MSLGSRASTPTTIRASRRIASVWWGSGSGVSGFLPARADNLADGALVEPLFTGGEFDFVVNLAVRAVVRYPIDNLKA